MKILGNELDSYEKRCEQYQSYLETHIANVQRAWEEVFKPLFLRGSTKQFEDISEAIKNHDESKYWEAEWEGYLDHFYEGSGKSQKEIDMNFKYAWLHHQHNNPHHWQYWLLKEDDSDDIEALDMPLEQVICMLCDWHSFRYVDDSITTEQWYKDNRSNMILSENTERLIEQYIKYLK